MSFRLLIVEESLRDLKAHWFEYIQTITQAAEAQNWSVDVACHQNVEPEIQKKLSTCRIFRHARYLDNQTQKLPGEHYYGFILHSLRCLRVLWPHLSNQAPYDHVFVPTVLVHHLLAWWIIAQFHPHRPRHLTLFFVTHPGVWNSQTGISYLPRSAQIQGFLLKCFRGLIQRGKVIFGVETQGAKREFEALTGLPFTLFSHPVPPLIHPSRPDIEPDPVCSTTTLVGNDYGVSEVLAPETLSALATLDLPPAASICFACYGFARYEKGSDLLKQALEQLLETQSVPEVQFRIQWIDPLTMPDGSRCEPGLRLSQHPQVSIIDRPLLTDDYQALLSTTHCMILPYRNASYYARVSRVAIEAACLGIPMIYTKGGWLEELVVEFGAGIGIVDENVNELKAAISTLFSHYASYSRLALEAQERARQYFSGDSFCKLLFQPTDA